MHKVLKTIPKGNRTQVFVDNSSFLLYKGEMRKYHIEPDMELEDETYRKILEVLYKRAKERALYLLDDSYKTEKQIADAVDRVVDKMLKETPPETEEERQNCETMRETIKGMFLTQRRSKTEAAFITENIDRYEELFEICMNGDDAQFKKGITELQKAQNEYILQKERVNG